MLNGQTQQIKENFQQQLGKTSYNLFVHNYLTLISNLKSNFR